MKKIIVYIATLFSISGTIAQPWVTAPANGPVKLQDVITYYQSHPLPASNDDKDNDKDAPEREDKNYQFDRWKWYWQNHTDADGYLVSPVKTLEEWQAYTQRENSLGKLAKTTSGNSQSNWSFQGPSASIGGYNGVGRVNTVAFHPTDSNTILAGSAGGGVWKSTDNGNTWASISGNLPILGVSAMAFNPLNGNTIYLCSGDGDGGDTYSVGVLKSVDGGNTWNTTGLVFASNVMVQTPSIVVNPQDTNTVIVATTSGIYRSLNAGATWTNVFSGSYKQVLYNVYDTNVVYASGAHVGSSNEIYRSADGGATWQTVTTIVGATRITLAVTKANPKIVKAIAAAANTYGMVGIYSSSDTGKTFSLICDGAANNCANNILGFTFGLPTTDCTGQGWYTLSLTMNPNDTTSLYAGGVNTWGSQDGGKTWHIVDQWYSSLPGVATLHADKHFLAFNPIATDRMYECNDGGIYTTTSPGSTLWTDITTGLGITQYYRGAVSNVATYVLGGAQDDGCMAVTGGQSYARNVLGGDGMQVQMDYTDPQIFYAESQYGDINVTYNGGITTNNISNNIASPAPKGSWVTPFILDPQVPTTIYAGYDKVYMSTAQGSVWAAISPVLSNGNTIDRVVVSPVNGLYMYALVNNSIHYTKDGGTTWTTMSMAGAAGNISDIVADPKDQNILWATFSGYTVNKVARHSFATNSWTLRNGQLPNIPINCLTIDTSNGTVYIGAEVGVYYYDSTNVKWVLYNTGLPNVVIEDLNINYTTGDLWAATFGRGMWKTPRIDTAPNLGVSVVPYAANVLTIFPDPNYGDFTVSTNDKAFIDKKVSVRLMSTNGRVVWNATSLFNDGRLPVSAKGLTPGIYIFEVSSGSALARQRVVIY